VSGESEINIFRALDYIRDNAPKYAKARAERVYLEEFRKSKKALLMRIAEQKGFASAVSQEREAYADNDYQALLLGLKDAVEAEETLRWQFVSAQAKIEVWRTIEANKRAEAKNL